MSENPQKDTLVFSDGLHIKPHPPREKFLPGDIVTIKLISGEELLAKIERVDQEGYEVRKPLVMNLVQVPGSATQAGVVFVPFLISSDEKEPVYLEKRNIVAIAKPNKEAQRGYVKNTTGLDLPGAGIKNLDLTSFKGLES